MKLVKLAACIAAAITLVGCGGGHNGKANIQSFYDFLSNPSSQTHADSFRSAVSDDWVSIGDYSGKRKSSDAFIGQVGGFGGLIPDLNWEVQSMHRAGKHVTVRSRATGTPAGPLFGVDGKGKKFDILTIDIHTLEDGVITKTYHVEDWSGALRQLSSPASAQVDKPADKSSLETVQSFMEAMGSGNMEGMSALMADDMVWHNEGDKTLPWIGRWEGKEAIFGFLPIFSKNMQTTLWETEDMFASGDTVAAFGKMNGKTTKSGKDIGVFTFGLRVKVRDGQIVLWNWLEDSYAISQAYHGK